MGFHPHPLPAHAPCMKGKRELNQSSRKSTLNDKEFLLFFKNVHFRENYQKRNTSCPFSYTLIFQEACSL